MKACYYETTGPARQVLQFGTLPDPEPGPGEVRVRVRWTGVNPSDVKGRAGARSKVLAFPRIVPHSDGAGVIDQVGEGVAASRVGERVWTWNAAWQRPMGTAAQCVVLPSAQAVRLPDAVELEAGACLGIPTLTALHAVRCAGGVQGKTVLVSGGAGAVGHYAVQMARRLGAKRVLATVSSDEKARAAEEAGADACINYRTQDVVAAVRDLTAGALVDRVVEVDIASNGAMNTELLRPGGEAVVYGSGAASFTLPFFPHIARNLSLHFFIVYALSPEDRAAALATLGDMLEAGALSHRIARRLPMNAMAEAHELVESGRAVGNVVVAID
jgi:NADPH2:quinone reductase